MSVGIVNGFTGTVILSLRFDCRNGSCSVIPVRQLIPATANVTVNAASLGAGIISSPCRVPAGSPPIALAVPFNVADYQLSGTQALTISAGAQGTAKPYDQSFHVLMRDP